MNNRTLWKGVVLPTWNPDRLYALFQRHVAAVPSESERQEYAKLLMVFITANMTRTEWGRSLRRRRLDAEDVAADILHFLIEKTPGIRLQKPCAPVLLKFLNVTVYHQLVSALRRRHIECRLFRSMEHDYPVHKITESPPPLIERLSCALRDAEELLCQGLWADQIGICILYRYLCRQVIRQNSILSYAQLPERLRRRINVQEHALISYRLNRFIHEFAAA